MKRSMSYSIRKSILWAGALALLFCSCRSAARKSELSVRDSQASYVLTATALADDYAGNPAAADDKYKGKVLFVTGAVDYGEEDLKGGYVLNVRAGTEWYDVVSCTFSKTQLNDLLKLTRGDYVRVKGRCAGKNPAVSLTDCILVDEKGAPIGG